MSRARAAAAAIVLIATALVLLLGVLAPGARRVDIRWAAAASIGDRVRAEDSLHLDQPQANGERTFSYRLLDTSPANVQRVVTHPLVEDTARIDRAQCVLAPEVPEIRAHVRQAYQRWPLRSVSRQWRWLVAALLVTALVTGWPWLVRLAAHPHRLIVGAVLAISLLLRLSIVMGGGQFYWPDEGRYRQSRELVEALAAHDTESIASVLDEPPHLVFSVLMVPPAAVEFARGEDPAIPAVFLALFSVINIWLIGRIARQLGASSEESVLAVVLFAASLSGFYYARHLFPYDMASTFAYLAMLAGTAREARWPMVACSGVLAGCAFLTYSGAWTVGGAACLVCVLAATGWRVRLRRMVLVGGGLALAIVTFVAVYAIAGVGFIDRVVRFAGTVNQGNFSEGWSLPVEYLWRTEHWLAVVWLGSLAWSLWSWRSRSSTALLRAGLTGFAFIYAALVICSSGLSLFVVYGRLARQVVPFLCLVSADVMGRAWQAWPTRVKRPVALVGALLLVAQVVVNFGQPLRQRFPTEFARTAEVDAVHAGDDAPILAFTSHIYPRPEAFEAPPGYRVLEWTRHPLQFEPYQYAGYGPVERQMLRSQDIRMRVLVHGIP